MIYVSIYLWGFSNTLSHSSAYFLINRVKKEHSVYIRKRSATGGGPPPTPPKYSPLAAAASLLMENELAYAEKQYDSAVSQPDILILQERDIGKIYCLCEIQKLMKILKQEDIKCCSIFDIDVCQ